VEAVSTLIWPQITFPERVFVRLDADAPDVSKPEGMLSVK
jgi:hypothetical protein